MEKKASAQLSNYLPIVVDLLFVIANIVLIPVLSRQFQDRSLLNPILIGFVYLLFCASVYGLRKLDAESGESSWQWGSTLAFLAVFFGIMVTYLMAETAGVFEEDSVLDAINSENSLHMILVTVSVLIWLATIFLYTIILIVNIKSTVGAEEKNYQLIAFLTLAGINLMIAVTLAGWESIFADTEPYESIGFGAKFLIFLATYIFFLLFFAPPRLVYVVKNPRFTSYVSFLLVTAYYVWRSLSRTAW